MRPEDRVVARLIAVFGEPKTPDPVLFLEEFAKAVKPFDADVLEKATDEVIRDCAFWPRPKEIVDRAIAYATKKARRNVPPPREEPRPPPLTPEQRSELKKIMADFYERMNIQGDDAHLVDWKRGQRPQFEEMMRTSPNRHLYVKDVGTLTEVSKRMTGEKD